MLCFYHINFYKRGAHGANGVCGSNGSFCIKVNGQSFPWRYNLVVKSVSFYPTKQDGIIEPGCLVHVFTTYENNGRCYTPTHQVKYSS